MRLIALRLLASSSIALVLCASTRASTRPRYGGTLRVAMHAAITSIDPGNQNSGDPAPLTALVFDTLVTEDESGVLQTSLARAWSSDATYNRWQFWLRPNVSFHDGEPLTPTFVAEFLANAVAGCKTSAVGESVVFQCTTPQPALAAQLTSTRFAIVRKASTGKLEGTGPFALSEWDPGRRAVFTAFEDCWAGRPYLDRIEVTFAQDYRDQALALQLGRADLVELPAAEPGSNLRVSATAPMMLAALVFSHNPSVADERVRHAISLAVDRQAIAGVLLQGHAEAAFGLLPNWISGYESLFKEPLDLARARQLRGEVRAFPITLATSSADAELRLIAERIALNARDAGLAVQLTTDTQHADVVLTSISLGCADPDAALANITSALHQSAPEFRDDSLDSTFNAERALLRGRWIVPIAHLSRSWALSVRLRNWLDREDGQWRLADVWIEPNAAERRAR